MRHIGIQWLAAACAAWMMAGAAAAQEAGTTTDGLRHAVVCPPFKGPAALAGIYHAEIVEMLQKSEYIEYLAGTRALMRRAPEFTFRVVGEIIEDESGQAFVTVSLVDAARKEQIAAHMAPASTERASIAAWRKTIQSSMERRASKLPFECRVRRKAGQSSYTLDRGLGAGLLPGMKLFVAMDEEQLISPHTGEVIGRDSPRAMGQIEVFRVMEHNAYARPVTGNQLPRTGKLYARTF
jgi:hypothetical protein